ncbi:hypothetical protein NC796_22000 [Aliifodinibius sp. S!AR15-10]|uniref:hypothetical protein n=1 Tax=Aliifodinibius sp. S!AR15-10 TaxID=2950437 RepID=UPI0028578B3E|nr:hypothetical protein [Aliifodinibius sp. S!AR15-10]MDR8393842.1 hypothetical protein [Aliifodinibius sp. S!AR15-10]
MKRKKLKFMDLGGKTLSRGEMKSIMAGSGGGGSGVGGDECQACYYCDLPDQRYICCIGTETCESGNGYVKCDSQPALVCY